MKPKYTAFSLILCCALNVSMSPRFGSYLKRSKVKGSKFHAHAHLPLIGSLQVWYYLAIVASIPWTQQCAQESHGHHIYNVMPKHQKSMPKHTYISIHKNPKVKVMSLRSKVTGPKSMLMHTYPSWVIHIPNFGEAFSIAWR